MNLLSGCAGALTGAVVSVPTAFFGGAIGQKLAETAKCDKAAQVAVNGLSGAASSLAMMAFLSASPFTTGVKVSLAAAAIIYAAAQGSGAVTINAQKEKANITDISTYSLDALKSTAIGSAAGITVSLFGSIIAPLPVAALLGAFTSYTLAGYGTVYAGVKHGVFQPKT